MYDRHGLGLDVRELGFETGLRRLNEYRRNRTSESDAVSDSALYLVDRKSL